MHWASRSPSTQAEDHLFGVTLLQRLVGARRAALGVPAARPLPGEELRQHRLAVDRHDGGAGAVPRAVRAPRGRSAAAALPRRRRQPCAPARSTSSSRCGCRPPRCARPASRPRSSRAATPPKRPTGPPRSSSRTTPSTAATCRAATCSARARCPARGRASRGSMLELSAGGKQPITLPNGETAHLPRGRRHADPRRSLRACRRAAHRLRHLQRHGAAGGLRPHPLRARRPRAPARPSAACARPRSAASPGAPRRRRAARAACPASSGRRPSAPASSGAGRRPRPCGG